jgi:flagellar motor protein MotB
MVLKGKVSQYEQQQAVLTRQNNDLQARATTLDKDNQQLQELLSRSQQQIKISEDQLAATKEQLRGMTAQLAQLKSDKDSTDKKVQAMTASMQRQNGVVITPNNSFLQTMPAINLPDVFVRRDGDSICVELPSNRLFEPGTDRLRQGAPEMIVAAATELMRSYPDQMIGVEGHTDNEPIAGGPWRSNHQLSTARAMAVYDVLTTRTRLQADQLCVVGRGSNRPIFSNAETGGKQRNQRVELVVYPEKRGGK